MTVRKEQDEDDDEIKTDYLIGYWTEKECHKSSNSKRNSNVLFFWMIHWKIIRDVSDFLTFWLFFSSSTDLFILQKLAAALFLWWLV